MDLGSPHFICLCGLSYLLLENLCDIIRRWDLSPVAYGDPSIVRDRSEPGGTRWRTGGEVKWKLENGVGSQYYHATSERSLSSITQADAQTSAASSRLNWRPHRFKWTLPFRGKTKSGFCACAITFPRELYVRFCVRCILCANPYITIPEVSVRE